MSVTRIWDADAGQWRLVGGTFEGDPGSGYLPIFGGQLTGPLLLDGDPTVPTGAATKAYVDALTGGAAQAVPTGGIIMFGGSVAPLGYLICDGSLVSRGTYDQLFAAIGTTFGAGDGSTTFALPDLRQRFPIGKAASGTASGLGETGGTISHTHSTGAHTHDGPSHTHTGPSHTHDLGNSASGGGGTSGNGGGHGHTFPERFTGVGGSHAHSFSDTTGGSTANANMSGGSLSVASSNHVHSVSGTTGSGGSHDHVIATFTIPSAAAHAHSTPNHAHDLGASAAAGTGATGAAGTGATGAAEYSTAPGGANPPFIALNFIIKI